MVSRRVLLEEVEPTPPGDLAELLKEVAALLKMKQGTRYYYRCRANDCMEWSRSDDPAEAVERAISLRAMIERNKKASA